MIDQSRLPAKRGTLPAYMAADQEDRASGYYPGEDEEDEGNHPPLLGDNREPAA